jgi:AcrR family transcriptional regulator
MPRGRPREFDLEKALDAALLLFWQHGYEGTSLAALTEAMGVNVPSLYAAFGNKEELFQKVLDRYNQKFGTYFRDALNEPTAREVVEKIMHGAVHQVTRTNCPHGCLLVQGALVSCETNDSVRKILSHFRMESEKALRKRLERALREGDLPPGSDPAKLARFVWTVNLGMAVQAAGGATRTQLEEVVEMVLNSWPK